MTIEIRRAKREDANEIAPLLLLAMQDIVYEFIGVKSEEKARHFLMPLINEKTNQYSYENCWVVEREGVVVGVANVYDGASLELLRSPVLARIKKMFNRDIFPEDETQPGEIYIDCVGVRSDQQGAGIGSKLFRFLIDEYVNKNQKTLGLLVDKENPHAKRLYLKLGFEVMETVKLTNKELEHLQLRPMN